jgi:hypothetical protein
MARTLLDKAREERTLDRRGYQSTLGRLFPLADPRSPAMWRLAIIRDDIDFEVNGVAVPEEADDERMWQHGYFLRRLSVSILEAKNVFVGELAPMLKESAGLLGGVMREPVENLAAELQRIEPMIAPLRDAFGAHVRPNNANPDRKTTEAYDVRGLRTHANWEATVTLNKLTPIGTTYREFTKMAYLFAWPEVVDEATLMKHATELQPLIAKASADVAAAIDGVLYAFWLDLKAIAPLR